MRRVLFVMLVSLVMLDAAGLESFLFREPCVSVSDQTPDNGCPATCFRCSCGQPVVTTATPLIIVTQIEVAGVEGLSSALLSFPPRDVLHVPKPASLFI
jgi:hypothetical protein